MSPRSLLRQKFLKDNNYLSENLQFLASDMSVRQYYRLSDSCRVLMDAPPPEKCDQYIAIARFLIKIGLRAPIVFEYHLGYGFLLIEDFGDRTFSKVLKENPDQEEFLYKMAIDSLKYLHQQVKEQPLFIEEYDVSKMLSEVKVFMDWYWPTVKDQASYQEACDSFLKAWREILLGLPSTPQSLVLRDYHVDNLMHVKGQNTLEQCGLLDFQDAVWGSVVYDFISLVEDARRDVDADLQVILWEKFLENIPAFEHENYREVATAIGAARHMKVMGVFSRFALKGGNSSYLNHIPRLWRYLFLALKHPTLSPLKKWFDQFFPLNTQKVFSL